MDLSSLHRILGETYGAVDPVHPHSAFEWVVWDTIPNAPDPEFRRAAYRHLRDEIGLTPDAIADASVAALAALLSTSSKAKRFASQVQEAARRVRDVHGGDLDSAVRSAFAKSRADAVRLLRKFAWIGQPAADRILNFLELEPGVALDSNGVRIVARLAGLASARSYDAQYRNARRAIAAMGSAPAAKQRELHFLLQTHGRSLCKAAAQCGLCPLRESCAYGGSRPGTRSFAVGSG